MVLINKLIKGASSRTFETRLIRKDGAVIDVLWSATWSKIEKALFCVAHDITQRKEVERLKHDFYTMVSHDLRTPLTSILFSLNIVLKRIENLSSQLVGRAAGETTKDLTDELHAAENNCAHLLKLIDSMLTVEKIEAGEIQLSPKMFKLSALIKKAADSIGAYARQQEVSLIWNFDEVVIAADEDRLLQVLINLLGNAIKFSPLGGQIKLNAHLKGGQLVCEVEDQGPGIPEQYLATIFDRYKQVKNPGSAGKGGTGLGLTICQAIVKAHNGELGVNSTEGKGSTFWFKIPVTSFSKLSERQLPKQDSQDKLG
jgi:signal transduction histidine kinase